MTSIQAPYIEKNDLAILTKEHEKAILEVKQKLNNYDLQEQFILRFLLGLKFDLEKVIPRIEQTIV
jgi:hypothetical protein